MARTGIPHLGVVDKWSVTPKRARYSACSLSRDGRIMQLNAKKKKISPIFTVFRCFFFVESATTTTGVDIVSSTTTASSIVQSLADNVRREQEYKKAQDLLVGPVRFITHSILADSSGALISFNTNIYSQYCRYRLVY